MGIDRHFSRARLRGSRRGVAVIVALGLMAITLTISYTLLRTQSTSSMIQANASRGNQARQAAMAGIQRAMKKIHEANWQGVTVPLTGSVTATDSYRVTFVTGDPTLSEADDDYGEYPYRLTLRSTGTSVDPADANRKAEHTIEVVMQLVRERMTAPPTDWNDLLDHTLTQWNDSQVEVNIPFRVEGSARLNGELRFNPDNMAELRPFDGLIDEVAILSDSLSESELHEIYTGVSNYSSHWFHIRDWWRLDDAAGSTHANNLAGYSSGIYEGATPGESPSPYGGSGSARFDGENDGISLGSIDVGGSELTLMAWIKADDFGSSDARIISKAHGTNESDHWWMLSTTRNGNDHKLRFRLKSLFGSTDTLVASSGDLPTGQWLFVAATYDGFHMKLYVNGQEVGSQFRLGALATNSSVPVWIGENPPGNARGLYFRHLNRMRDEGYDDLRPFEGPLTVRTNTLDEPTRSLLSDEMALSVIDDPANENADYSSFSPPEVSEYQLYPGGATYSIPILNDQLSNQVLEADMTDNPLGVFRANNHLRFLDNVSVHGAIFGPYDVELLGRNVELEGIDLPPLHGSAERVQLPCLSVGRRFNFLANSAFQAHGMIVAADNTTFHTDADDMTASITGRLATAGLTIQPRLPWGGYSSSTWEMAALAFESQRREHNGIPYFPAWLDELGLSSNPHFKIAPPSDTIRYHWHDWSQPLYLPETDGEGLRWNLVRWDDHG